jgi:hypothetical protein
MAIAEHVRGRLVRAAAMTERCGDRDAQEEQAAAHERYPSRAGARGFVRAPDARSICLPDEAVLRAGGGGEGLVHAPSIGRLGGLTPIA